MKGKVREIGSGKQLFVDDYVVEEMKNVSKTLNPAKKHPNNPLIVPDRPWEGHIQLYGSVIYDEKEKIFKMWYCGGPAGCLYATSKDGLRWEKPNLGIYEYEGSKENNIVPNGPYEGLIYCPEMKDAEGPEKVYKCLRYTKGGWQPFFSPDGLHWSLCQESSVIRGSDECKMCKAHEYLPGDQRAVLPKYAAFPKHGITVGKFPRRSVAVSFSEDSVNWSNPIPFFTPDELDDEAAEGRIAEALEAGVIDLNFRDDVRGEFYHMCVFPYDGMYFGLVDVFYVTIDLKRLGRLNQGGPDEVQLTASRNLIHWQRVGDRRPIISNVKRGVWYAGWKSAASDPVVVGDELWIYYGGTNTDHGGLVWTKTESTCGIGLATLRLDGFVSVDAGEQEGTLTTKPLTFEGGRLEVNAQAKGGSVVVEVLDEKGKPMRGFTRGDCDAFSGDSVRHTVTWKGSSDVSSLQGKNVKLRFHLKKAKLYAFSFKPR